MLNEYTRLTSNSLDILFQLDNFIRLTALIPKRDLNPVLIKNSSLYFLNKKFLQFTYMLFGYCSFSQLNVSLPAGELMPDMKNIQFIVELFIPFVILGRSRQTTSHLDESRLIKLDSI